MTICIVFSNKESPGAIDVLANSYSGSKVVRVELYTLTYAELRGFSYDQIIFSPRASQEVAASKVDLPLLIQAAINSVRPKSGEVIFLNEE